MQDFYLFVDTETSGLPKDWDAPYSAETNWPHILQIAWIIFDRNFKEIKRENYYVKADGIIIDKAAQKIHKLSPEFLETNGEPLEKVMNIFNLDFLAYQPLVIGHFIELDYHMVNVSLFRLQLPNLFEQAQFFCTMKASAAFVRNPTIKFLKLGRFYRILFNAEMDDTHDALADAEHTAKIFFYLLATQKISVNSIYAQEHNFTETFADRRKSFLKRLSKRFFPWIIS
ncbi:3'-5' exonuclease [Pedobacter sandarakinus]|uniref:3'-5' exonuclease n=1 Tax=Pedobacter sandarakinus TaxID=353156 RepID=UPI0022452ED8|nr:3'-5' exonuclease [Pedobacter sandarakinus]MCX2574550.1 3'-5' exonuclease [Pedobacter sandarakinus]